MADRIMRACGENL